MEKTAKEFLKTNSNGLVGPVDDTVDRKFMDGYNPGLEEVQNALSAIQDAFSGNPEAFPRDVREAAESSIMGNNSITMEKLRIAVESFDQYLIPYLEEAMQNAG